MKQVESTSLKRENVIPLQQMTNAALTQEAPAQALGFYPLTHVKKCGSLLKSTVAYWISSLFSICQAQSHNPFWNEFLMWSNEAVTAKQSLLV